MTASFFNPEAPLWRAVGRLGDLIAVNVMALLGSLPIVTAGASLAAIHDTTRKLATDTGGGVISVFWAAWRANLRHGIGLGLLSGLFGAGIIASWIYLPISELAVIKTLVSVIFLATFPLLWEIQARLENSIWRTAGNAVVIAVASLGWTMAILVVNLALTLASLASWWWLPQLAWLPALIGYPGLVALTRPLLDRAVAPLIAAAETV